MATYIDRITDGTISLELAGADFIRQRFSYSQQIADRDEFGFYRPISEQWRVNWVGRAESERALTLSLLTQLQRKAREWGSGKRGNGPVWREVATTSEGALRYALVSDIRVPLLDGRAYAPARSGVPADITVVREGAWRDRPPLEGGDVLKNAVTTYTYEAGVSKNYIDIGPGKFDGDADALINILIDHTSYATAEDTRFMFALKSVASYADLSQVQVGFNAADGTTFTGAHLSADANAPGGQIATIPAATVASTFTASWDLPANAPYDGEYMLFIHAKASGGDELIEARLSDPQTGDWAAVPTDISTRFSRVYLGRVRLPRDRIHHQYATYAATDFFDVQFRHPSGSAGTADVIIRDAYLVPVDEGVVTAVRYGANAAYCLIDGTLYDDAFLLNGSLEIATNKAYLVGRPLALRPDRYNRLFFYMYGVNNDVSGGGDMTEFKHHVLNSVGLTVDAVSRYVAVRRV